MRTHACRQHDDFLFVPQIFLRGHIPWQALPRRMTTCGMCDNLKEAPLRRGMTTRGRLLGASFRRYGLVSPREARHSKDLVYYSDRGMLCRGVEPAIPALT